MSATKNIMDDLELLGIQIDTQIETQPQEFKYREKEDTKYMGRVAYSYDESKQYGPEAVEREQTYTDERQNEFLLRTQNRMGQDAYLRGIHDELTKIRAQVNEERTEFKRDYSNFLTEQLELDESKYRGKDGVEMQRVKTELRTLTTILQTPISMEQQTNLPMHVIALERQYDLVINACELYEETHNPWFATGKRRLRMVKDMKEFCIKERALLSPALNRYLESDAQGDITWGDILYNVRAITIDKAHIQKAEGGLISDVHRISLDGGQTYKFLSYETSPLMVDFFSKMKSGIEDYKEKEKINPDLHMAFGDGFSIMERLQKAAENHSEEELNLLSSQLIDLMYGDKTWKNEDYERMPEWAKTAIAINDGNRNSLNDLKNRLTEFSSGFIRGARSLATVAETRIHLDAVISRRNVATSRVSSMLGMDDIIKKSRTVIVKGEGGKLERANLMDEAAGISMSNLRKKASAERKKIAYTPEATRQLVKLEIFDAICAQTDRHNRNYNVVFEEHDNNFVITSVQVFDNDMAFGDLCFNDIRRGAGSQGGLFFKKNATNVLTAETHRQNMEEQHKIRPEEGESYLFHHMDRELYEKIVDLDEMKEFLVLQLVELGISETEINALKDRISGIRQFLDQAIADEVKAEGKLPYLLDKEQWQQMNLVSDIQPEGNNAAKINHDKWIEGTLWKQK